jgi:hypothetical protein
VCILLVLITQEEVSHRTLRFSPVGIILTKLHTLLFIDHGRYVILASDSINQQNAFSRSPTKILNELVVSFRRSTGKQWTGNFCLQFYGNERDFKRKPTWPLHKWKTFELPSSLTPASGRRTRHIAWRRGINTSQGGRVTDGTRRGN